MPSRSSPLIGIARPRGAVADADGVDVTVERDHRSDRSHAAQHVAQAVDRISSNSRPPHLVDDAVDDAAFLGALGGNRDHLPKEGDDVRRVLLGEGSDVGGARMTHRGRTLETKRGAREAPSTGRKSTIL